jgi:hypothetical protein
MLALMVLIWLLAVTGAAVPAPVLSVVEQPFEAVSNQSGFVKNDCNTALSSLYGSIG